MSNGNYPSYNIPGVGEYGGYVIWSALDLESSKSGCIGVQKGTAAPGIPLVLTDAPDIPSAPTLQWLNDNAYWQWALWPGPAPYESSYYIVSMLQTFIKLGPFEMPRGPFVIDIGGKAADGTALVINPMAGFPDYYRLQPSVSQLWNVVEEEGGNNTVTLQSVQDPSLVISVYGASPAAGTPLVLWQIMETAGTPTYPNQIWIIMP
jgi:hypothetical protein